MKTKFVIFALIGALLCSCKKDKGVQSSVASLNVINATTDASALAVNNATPSLIWFENTSKISVGSSMEFSLPQGSNILNIISSVDTIKPFLQGKLNLITGGIYSFYVAGQVAHYDTLFMRDDIPSYGADSVAGARFINLVTDSPPLNISLVGNTIPEFNNVAFKKITVFKKYIATNNIITNGGYNYAIRNASGTVLATFNWNPQTFKNNTLVITGSVNSGTTSVFTVNNY